MKCEVINYKTCEEIVGTVKIIGSSSGDTSMSLSETGLTYNYGGLNNMMHFDSLIHAKKVALKMLEIIEELE